MDIAWLESFLALIEHGSFTRAVPMGCLATQIAWNHPRTCHLTLDAGVSWLNGVAGLNPATSHVIREWDRASTSNYEMRAELLAIFKKHRNALNQPARENRLPELVET